MVNCCLVIPINSGLKTRSCLHPAMCLLQDTIITTKKLHWALLNQTPLYIKLAERAGKVLSVPLNSKTLRLLFKMKYTTLQEIIENNYSFCVVQLDF